MRIPEGQTSGPLQSVVASYQNVSVIDLTSILKTVQTLLGRVSQAVQVLSLHRGGGRLHFGGDLSQRTGATALRSRSAAHAGATTRQLHFHLQRRIRRAWPACCAGRWRLGCVGLLSAGPGKFPSPWTRSFRWCHSCSIGRGLPALRNHGCLAEPGITPGVAAGPAYANTAAPIFPVESPLRSP